MNVDEDEEVIGSAEIKAMFETVTVTVRKKKKKGSENQVDRIASQVSDCGRFCGGGRCAGQLA